MLRNPDGVWADEATAVHQTGLATGSWVATNQTGSRVATAAKLGVGFFHYLCDRIITPEPHLP